MSKQKKKKYGSYLEFLETRLNSSNFKARATKEEYDEVKRKYDREKLVQRLLGKKK
jgi:hypothetical protein